MTCRHCRSRDHDTTAHADVDVALLVADQHAREGNVTQSRLWIAVARKLANQQTTVPQ